MKMFRIYLREKRRNIFKRTFNYIFNEPRADRSMARKITAYYKTCS